MAKKQKRNIPQGTRVSPAPSSSGLASNRAPVTSRPPAAARQPLSGLRPSAAVEFNPDYTYAKQDLKRVGIMAASFIGALIVLSFVLPLFIK
jgi:hypothetical protein